MRFSDTDVCPTIIIYEDRTLFFFSKFYTFRARFLDGKQLNNFDVTLKQKKKKFNDIDKI